MAITNFAVTNRCNGRCTVCNIWKMERARKIGNINQNRLQDILSPPSSHEAREKIQKLQCSTCLLECNAYSDIKKNKEMLINALLKWR